MNTSLAPLNASNDRIQVIDALRGLALSGIMLVHQIEHFNFYKKPLSSPEWLTSLDATVWESIFFMFGGKAYAAFSLLFGFGFWIQYSNCAAKGFDFGYRFIWRMVLLLGFGLLHTTFFTGDILIMYAVLSFPLFFIRKQPSWLFLSFALLLLIRPLDLAYLASNLLGQGMTPISIGKPQWNMLTSSYTSDSLFDITAASFKYGISSHFTWAWEAGRIFQAPGLFLLGAYLAKKGVFLKWTSKNWIQIFLAGIGLYFVCSASIKHALPALFDSKEGLNIGKSVLESYGKLSLMASMVASVFLLWNTVKGRSALALLAPYGRMSLTNYLMQSAIGTFLYHGWGLELWKVAGSTVSLLIGIIVLIFQIMLSHWWLKSHQQGPLEYLWKQATWINHRKIASKS